MKSSGVVLGTMIALAPGFSWALGPVKFGAEFTFHNNATLSAEGRERVVERMRNHLVLGQPAGEEFTETEISASPSPQEQNSLSLGRFTSPAGWWFEWGNDDGVIEIKTKPGDPDYYRKYESDMQDAIFASAANENFGPALWTGGGHINMGTSVFEGNDLLLRNFIVDMVNHNELFLGVWNHDTNNAISLSLQAPSVQKKFAEVIEKFDRGEFTGEDSQLDFMDALQKALNAAPDRFFTKWKSLGNYDESSVRNKKETRWTYFGFNFSHVSKEAWSRIEIRGVRPQLSMDMWIRQIELIHRRLLYLEKIREPIALKPRVPLQKVSLKKPQEHHLNPPVDPQLALQSYYVYVTETGLRWQDHRDYMWPQWMNEGGARDLFERSDWFKSREGKKNCASLMKREGA